MKATPDTTDALVDGIEPPDTNGRVPAESRLQDCREKIQAVLDEFDCSILPSLTTEPVGYVPGAKVLVGATYRVVPNMQEP